MRKFLLFFLSPLLVLLLIQCQPDKVTITPINQGNTTNTDSTTTDTTGSTPSDTTTVDTTGTGTTPTDTTTTDTTGTGGTGTGGTTSGDTITVNTSITSDVTWVSGNTYLLDDLIVVTNGATLTIESCVVVKASFGATGLVIDKGASIDAQGTATCPIIFTSVNDALLPGDIVSPNLTGDDTGLWGGIFILGDAPVSSPVSPAILTRLPQQSPNVYGGQSSGDNSGTMSYVSIRHTGYEMVTDEVPCGLTLAGVSSGTTIDHVELFANVDDGFLVLGGTANMDHLITSKFNDDGYDLSMGYAGIMDNIIGVGGNSRNSAFELDGGIGATNPSFTIQNVSFKGGESGEDYIDFQAGVNCVIENAYFFGFDADAEVKLDRDRDADNWLASLIDVVDLELNTSHLSSGNTTIGSIFVDAGLNGNDAFTIRVPDANIVTVPTVGADKTEFTGWTVADLTGALNDF